MVYLCLTQLIHNKMSEEKEEGGMSAIVKAVVGAITTAIAAGGAWFAGLFGGGGSEPASTPAASPAPVVVNVQQNQENKQQTKQSGGGTNTIIKERVIEKPAAVQPAAPATKPQADEEDPW